MEIIDEPTYQVSDDTPQLTIERIRRPDDIILNRLNRLIFNEDRLINRFDRPNLMLLLAKMGDYPVGFKVGYGLKSGIFYSAKGGILPDFRRRGIARALLFDMMMRIQELGYYELQYDTFPNKDAGMMILGLSCGFKVVDADFNKVYQDYRIRLSQNVNTFLNQKDKT